MIDGARVDDTAHRPGLGLGASLEQPDLHGLRAVAVPGTPFATPSHVAIFLTGNTPITSRILKPALADASTGQVVSVRDMPWYATTLFMSQPLHFGDYGGLPLKIIWALFDIVTIVVLVSGLYLWWAKRRRRRKPYDASEVAS